MRGALVSAERVTEGTGAKSNAWAAIDGFTLSEPGSREECYVAVGVTADEILLALARLGGGDVEVGLDPVAARRVATALQNAVDRMPHIEGQNTA